MGFEVFQCVSLGPVIGEFLEIADLRAIFLSVDNVGCVHAAALQRRWSGSKALYEHGTPSTYVDELGIISVSHSRTAQGF